MSDQTTQNGEEQKSPLREIVQPFIDLIHAPRALWGINLAYVIEGMVYFGMLGYLAMHFSGYIFRGMEGADDYAHIMVSVLTWGITLAMFFLGVVADKKGVRFALLLAFVFMLAGRVVITSAARGLNLEPGGLWSPLHLVTMGGILLVVIGYGMYQPAAYAGIRKFTNPKTAAMGFAMLYALMNLGGWLPSFGFLLRDDDFAGLGIQGTYWIYTAFTAIALITTFIILTPKTVAQAIARAKQETKEIEDAEKESGSDGEDPQGAGSQATPPPPPGEKEKGKGKGSLAHLHILVILGILALIWRLPSPADYIASISVLAGWIILVSFSNSATWLRNHPLANTKFCFFIFALIPVQTLFTYNWLVLPQYINRSYTGWVGEYFEIFSNANPILIFIFVPIITILTARAKVYNMMIIGTFIMAAPTFFLAIGPYPVCLIAYILIMTIGEAMWQPRFLQYAAEIAPENQTGHYMGVAQFPWFLTKMLVPALYSGYMMENYCPKDGDSNTELMWFIFGLIAISSTLMLLAAKRWVGKDFKTKAD
jgi:MFS family permease